MENLIGIKQKIQSLLEFLIQNNLNKEIARLQEIDKFLESPKYNLSMVGEIGKGKSSVANMLLGEDILPVYMFEPLLISVQHGETANSIKMKDGSIRVFPQNFDYDKMIGLNYAEISLSIKNDFLKLNNLKLVDGYDINTNTDFGYLFSDMIIFVMNANAFLSTSEKNVILTIFDGKVKNLVLCITHIDQIKPEGIDKVYNLALSQYPDIPIVFVSNEALFAPTDEIKGNYGIEKITSSIQNHCTEGIDMEQRIAVVTYQLNLIILSAIEQLEQRKLEHENTKAEKFENYKTRVDNVKFQQLAWEDTRIEYENRENQCVEFIQNELTNTKSKIAERICQKLEMSSNPKEWWHRQLPFEMKSEISNLTTAIDTKLQTRIIADYNWLTKEVQTKFKQTLEGTIQKSETDVDYKIQPEADSLKNLKTVKYVSMAGTGVLATAMYFIVGPIGILVSAACGIISDRYLNKVIDDQKIQLKNSLVSLIEEVIGKISSLIPVRIHEIYDEFIEKTEAGEIEWIKSRKIDVFDCEETNKINGIESTIQKAHSLLNLN